MTIKQNKELRIWSNSLSEKEPIAKKYIYSDLGCNGNNISPHLEWGGAPNGTKSFAIIAFDPDAPTKTGWCHWGVINIPSNITKIEEGASNNNSLPANARETLTSYGEHKYGGPCPPKGDNPHRYIFSVYAIKEEALNFDQSLRPEMYIKKIEENSIGKAQIVFKYGRSK